MSQSEVHRDTFGAGLCLCQLASWEQSFGIKIRFHGLTIMEQGGVTDGTYQPPQEVYINGREAIEELHDKLAEHIKLWKENDVKENSPWKEISGSILNLDLYEYSHWAMSATYAKGDRCEFTKDRFFESTIDGNIDNKPIL